MRCFDRMIVGVLGACCGLAAGPLAADPYQMVRSALPMPPVGSHWQQVPQLSDEFDGGELDASRWIPYHPYWQGRAPSRFDTNNVSVGDGLLWLRSVSLVESLDEVGDPQKDIWVHSACVTSVDSSAGYGYYEARIKASSLSMTSSFWFQGRYSEIDVVEQIGDPLDHPQNKNQMLMNTHYYPDGWENDRKTPRRWEMPYAAAEDFHVYGVWWRDARNVWLYHDGERVAQIETGGAFDEPMFMFFDTEVFVWEGLPSIEALNDPERNAMQVDWVRAWRLVPDTGPSAVAKKSWGGIKRRLHSIKRGR